MLFQVQQLNTFPFSCRLLEIRIRQLVDQRYDANEEVNSFQIELDVSFITFAQTVELKRCVATFYCHLIMLQEIVGDARRLGVGHMTMYELGE